MIFSNGKQNIEISKKTGLGKEEVNNIQISVMMTWKVEVSHKHYAETNFQECQELLLRMCEEFRPGLNRDVLQRSLQHLKSKDLPTCRSDFLLLITCMSVRFSKSMPSDLNSSIPLACIFLLFFFLERRGAGKVGSSPNGSRL